MEEKFLSSFGMPEFLLGVGRKAATLFVKHIRQATVPHSKDAGRKSRRYEGAVGTCGAERRPEK
jgi:hypothetical protein